LIFVNSEITIKLKHQAMPTTTDNVISPQEPDNKNQPVTNYAYHVTRKENLASIKAKGLELNVPADYGDMGDVKGIYLFKTIDDTENALYNWLGERINEWEEENDQAYNEVVLKVNITGLKNDLIDSVAYEWICLVNIEPSRIEDVQEM
jgi:hypothetical protein